MKASGGDGRREGDVAECDGKKLRQCKKKKKAKISIYSIVHSRMLCRVGLHQICRWEFFSLFTPVFLSAAICIQIYPQRLRSSRRHSVWANLETAAWDTPHVLIL